MSELTNCCGTTCDKQVLRDEIRQMVIDAYEQGTSDTVIRLGSPAVNKTQQLTDYLSKLNLSEK